MNDWNEPYLNEKANEESDCHHWPCPREWTAQERCP